MKVKNIQLSSRNIRITKGANLFELQFGDISFMFAISGK